MRTIELKTEDLKEVIHEWGFSKANFAVETLEVLEKLVKEDINVIYPINLFNEKEFVEFIATTNENILVANVEQIEQTLPNGTVIDLQYKVVVDKISKDRVSGIRFEENPKINGKLGGALNLEITIEGYKNLVFNSDRDSFADERNIELKKETIKDAIIKLFNELN